MENNSQHASSTPTDITLRLLEDITHDFSEEHKVGSGGYGQVFKGVHNGVEIAVKKLHHMPGLDDVQFKNEFNNLMRVQHKNIVRLVGYCYEIRHKHFEQNGGYVFAQMVERALCFEYLEGGSLDKHLSDESCGLDWDTRYKIIKGISEGLDYLHNGSKESIFHLDLKPANILLDKNMMPKIGDFGLSRLFASTATYTTKKIIGTAGYMPPEYIDKRKISPKFDVFSLGVIILQVMVGPLGYAKCADMPSEEFIELVLGNWGKRLQAIMPWHTSQQLKTCIEIALRCVETDRAKRPTITEIVDKLKKIDTAKRSLIGQSSESAVCAAMDPLELRFPFELNKEVSCVLQLTNRTDDTIAFNTKMNREKYYAQPDKGTVPPWSKRYIIVTMRAQENTPPDMQCNDMFLVQSRRLSKEDLTPDNIAEHFTRLMGKAVVVDEEKLPIVYVGVASTSTPIPR
ncbi:cysteine-rich receptor-like protein kinase 44 [Phragmites australis]|uniref:cysteine-rich receptor-like protein kinase 44 n=1 Tax=Phragmites australis TaxID=29695 RepID=UPI002D765273|nr:cysteine-rich receptor-like protein kinase 44 [Phragmites australis]